MKDTLENVTLRRPVRADAEAVVALQNRCDIDQTGEADSNNDWC
jgi:hypothetical protein